MRFEGIPQSKLECRVFGIKDPIALECMHVHPAPPGLTSGERDRPITPSLSEKDHLLSVTQQVEEGSPSCTP